jgi:hypothetical protein
MPTEEAEPTSEEVMHKRTVDLLRASTKCDRTYSGKYNHFCRWVDAERVGGRIPSDQPTYITRMNVDKYFHEVVVNMTTTPKTVRKSIVALKWYADNKEHIGEKFSVESETTSLCLKTQIANKAKNLATNGNGTDPHKGLKDLLPVPDREKIMRYIYASRTDWGALSVSFTWGQNAGLRGHSMRGMVYADINMSKGFGPEEAGPRARMPLLVLRKGCRNKDNFATDKQVGCWRHKNYLLCPVFALAKQVPGDLKNNPTINFTHEKPLERAAWWDTELIDIQSYSQQSSAVKEVYEKTGVISCKLTHHRTLAVQHAGSEGLAPFQISTMTKHMLDKLHSSYMCEVDKEVCKVMAGFTKEEPYFVPRTHLELPKTAEEYLSLLLPQLAGWRREAATTGKGDKSSCCQQFLNEVLPFFMEVLIQDSIYFVRDFPRHEVSQWLQVSFLLFLFKCLNFEST